MPFYMTLHITWTPDLVWAPSPSLTAHPPHWKLTCPPPHPPPHPTPDPPSVVLIGPRLRDPLANDWFSGIMWLRKGQWDMRRSLLWSSYKVCSRSSERLYRSSRSLCCWRRMKQLLLAITLWWEITWVPGDAVELDGSVIPKACTDSGLPLKWANTFSTVQVSLRFLEASC